MNNNKDKSYSFWESTALTLSKFGVMILWIVFPWRPKVSLKYQFHTCLRDLSGSSRVKFVFLSFLRIKALRKKKKYIRFLLFLVAFYNQKISEIHFSTLATQSRYFLAVALNLSNAPSCFMWPAFKDLLFTLHFLRAICDFPKMIFICNFLALKNIFSTHIAALLSDLLSSDLQILLYWTLTLRSLISGLFIPTNILGYASSSQQLSLNMLSGLLPSAGATFRISWRSLSSKKSVYQ